MTGDVVLSAKAPSNTWSDFFALRDAAGTSHDFMKKRPLNKPLRSRKSVQLP